jgi:hypothetical protein
MAPPDTLSHSNVTKIDPLAIGRSLDTSVPPAAPRQPAAGRQVGESYQLTEVVSPPSAPADQPPVGARFSAHAETPNTVKSVAADFSDSRKQIAMPPVATPSGSPSSAPSTTAPFAAPDHMVNPMTQTPLPAIAPANGHFAQPAGIVVSDDPRTARDRVQQATYLGAAPLQRPAGQPNPLRDATRTGGEAMSTDSPAGWSNPLR